MVLAGGEWREIELPGRAPAAGLMVAVLDETYDCNDVCYEKYVFGLMALYLHLVCPLLHRLY